MGGTKTEPRALDEQSLPRPNIVGWTDGIPCCALGCCHACEVYYCAVCVLSRQYNMITTHTRTTNWGCLLMGILFSPMIPIMSAVTHCMMARRAIAPRLPAFCYGLFCPWCATLKTDYELACRGMLPDHCCLNEVAVWEMEPSSVDDQGLTWRLRLLWRALKDKQRHGIFKLEPAPPIRLDGIRGRNPLAKPVRTTEFIIKNIKTTKQAVFVTASEDTVLDMLFYYPDLQWSEFRPSRLVYADPELDVDELEWAQRLRTQKSIPGETATEKSEPLRPLPTIPSREARVPKQTKTPDAENEEKQRETSSGFLSSVLGGSASASNQAVPVEKKTRRDGILYRPHWTACRSQFKEFDSVDDTLKPWFETTNGELPGLFAVDVAGDNAAWVSMQPNSMQQRWVLPDARRAVSLLDTNLSIPQRIYAAFEEFGGPFLENFLDACSLGYRLTKAMLDVEDDFPTTDLEEKALKVKEYAEDGEGFSQDVRDAFTNCMRHELMGTWETVWEFPDSCGPIKIHLSTLEDIMLMNWFETAVEAEYDVDVWYYRKSDPKYKPKAEGGVKTWLRRKVIRSGNEKAIELMEDFKASMSGALRKQLTKLFGKGSEGEDMVKALFPDLDSFCKLQAQSIDACTIGINPKLAPFDPRETTEQLTKKLDKWRANDAKDMDVLRAEASRRVREIVSSKSSLESISKRLRMPVLLERHFYSFKFLCVFPMQKDAPLRKPNCCKLKIWPEGHPSLTETVEMTPLMIAGGGLENANEIAETTHGMLINGLDEYDSDEEDDPRVKWEPYPNADFRGYCCDKVVATGVPYAVSFEMDGRTFMAENYPIAADDEAERVYYRRFQFNATARPYTINAFRFMGAVIP
jgi:hypothetical protein